MRKLNIAELINASKALKFLCFTELINGELIILYFAELFNVNARLFTIFFINRTIRRQNPKYLMTKTRQIVTKYYV